MENNTNIIELKGITKVYEDGYTAVDETLLNSRASRRSTKTDIRLSMTLTWK